MMTKTELLKAIKLLFEWVSSRAPDGRDRLAGSDVDELKLRLQGLLARLG